MLLPKLAIFENGYYKTVRFEKANLPMQYLKLLYKTHSEYIQSILQCVSNYQSLGRFLAAYLKFNANASNFGQN